MNTVLYVYILTSDDGKYEVRNSIINDEVSSVTEDDICVTVWPQYILLSPAVPSLPGLGIN